MCRQVHPLCDRIVVRSIATLAGSFWTWQIADVRNVWIQRNQIFSWATLAIKEPSMLDPRRGVLERKETAAKRSARREILPYWSSMRRREKR